MRKEQGEKRGEEKKRKEKKRKGREKWGRKEKKPVAQRQEMVFGTLALLTHLSMVVF